MIIPMMKMVATIMIIPMMKMVATITIISMIIMKLDQNLNRMALHFITF